MSIGYREGEVRQLVEVAGLTSGSRGFFILIRQTDKLDSGKIAPLLVAGDHREPYVDLRITASALAPLALLAQNGMVIYTMLHQGA